MRLETIPYKSMSHESLDISHGPVNWPLICSPGYNYKNNWCPFMQPSKTNGVGINYTRMISLAICHMLRLMVSHNLWFAFILAGTNHAGDRSENPISYTYQSLLRFMGNASRIICSRVIRKFALYHRFNAKINKQVCLLFTRYCLLWVVI